MGRSKPLPVGKLPPQLLEAVLRSCSTRKSSGVILGPKYGEDAAVLEVGGRYLIVKTDPITFTADRIGWYAVNINANDIATLGGRPRWFLATFLFPEGRTTATEVKRLVSQTRQACESLGICLCGGHSEITGGLDRPLVIGQMLGEVEKAKLVRKDQQRPGDLIVLTKGVAIEGTAILARQKAALLEEALGSALVAKARNLLLKPGISIVRDAQLAVRYGKIHAMHDPTEGGVLTALYELAHAGNVGMQVWRDRIAVLPETEAVARVLRADPLALLASGALLIVASRDSANRLIKSLIHHGIAAQVIGEIRKQQEGVMIAEGSRTMPLSVPRTDEIARLLA